ncbi:MAG: DNA-directed RNA polymerase subunit alpha C-terminal domain-containing protein, partial [Phycisphaerae bacterium]|nr:DNA-directed RNA polymerase subunit alpha C-terminal domain-containing protein [Phycisphaerae bacterium]
MNNLTEIEKACLEGRTEEAKELLAKAKSDEAGTADYHYQVGLVREAQGEYEQAIDAYEQALQLDATHRKTLFRLAYVYDLRGEESLAIDYYKQCVQHPPVHVGALMNLAVLYEELGDKSQLLGQADHAMELYDVAEAYLRRILAANPNHARARLFMRDIEKSRVMYYDEEKERRADKRNQKLDIPVTDFELSVRSRNCLQKMDVRSLGDLIKCTESDLLSYKNFGETSLAEIKQMLASQNLYLGMTRE